MKFTNPKSNPNKGKRKRKKPKVMVMMNERVRASEIGRFNTSGGSSCTWNFDDLMQSQTVQSDG